MGVQLRPGLGNRVIHKDFSERGRYVAHNRDVRYSPTHSELSDCTSLALPRYQATASQGTSVASSGDSRLSSYLLDDNNDYY